MTRWIRCDIDDVWRQMRLRDMVVVRVDLPRQPVTGDRQPSSHLFDHDGSPARREADHRSGAPDPEVFSPRGPAGRARFHVANDLAAIVIDLRIDRGKGMVAMNLE